MYEFFIFAQNKSEVPLLSSWQTWNVGRVDESKAWFESPNIATNALGCWICSIAQVWTTLLRWLCIATINRATPVRSQPEHRNSRIMKNDNQCDFINIELHLSTHIFFLLRLVIMTGDYIFQLYLLPNITSYSDRMQTLWSERLF